MGSPMGDELRQWAAAQAQLASDVGSLAAKYRPLHGDIMGTIGGFPFEGPLRQRIESMLQEASTMIDVAKSELAQAAGRIQNEAADSMARAATADASFVALAAFKDLFGGNK